MERPGHDGPVVALSIVGCDRVPAAYYEAKRRQEEFAGQMLDRGTRPIAVVPAMRVQPVAAREIAEMLVALAVATPAGRAPELRDSSAPFATAPCGPGNAHAERRAVEPAPACEPAHHRGHVLHLRAGELSRLTERKRGQAGALQLATHTGESPFRTLACWPMRVSHGNGTLAAHGRIDTQQTRLCRCLPRRPRRACARLRRNAPRAASGTT